MWRWDQAEPFGSNPADEDPDANSVAFDLPLRLPGQRYDKESGLHYNYFRDYDTGLGRYVQADPIGLDGGLNLYLYASAAPIALTDPRGLLGNPPGSGPYPPHHGPGASPWEIAGNIVEMHGGRREDTGCYLACIVANRVICAMGAYGTGVFTGGAGIAATIPCNTALNTYCFKQCTKPACELPEISPFMP
ncbi:MAG: RHS repeat-associated core domain-containing protein [Burkholderiales bacterium]